MSKRILLADDSLTIQKVVELTFMDEDFEVEAVGSGDEAVSRLSGDLPDILIADVHMPGASGYEVCRQAKALSADLPVLLLVGTFEALDEDEMVACGADGNLKKPFDSQELLQVVQRMTAGGPPTRSEGGETTEAAGLESTAHEEEAVEPPELPVTGFDLGRSEEINPAETVIVEPPKLPSTDFDFSADEGSESTGLEGEPEIEPVDLGLDDATEGGFGEAADAASDEAESSANETVLMDMPSSFAADASDGEPVESAAEDATGEDQDIEGEGAEDEGAEDAVSDASTVVMSMTDGAFGQPDEAGEPEASDEAQEPEVSEEAGGSEQSVETTSAAEGLSADDVERIAKRVVEMMSETAVREVAWDVIPDMAEIVIKERVREIEAEAEAD